MPFLCIVTLLMAADGDAETYSQDHALIVAATAEERVFVADAALFLDAQRMNPVTVEEINAFLKAEEHKDLLGCADVACYADIGGALDIKYVLQIEPNEEQSRAVLTLFELFPRPHKVQSKLVSHETALQALLRSTDDFRKKRNELVAVLKKVPCGFPWQELQETIGKPDKSRQTYGGYWHHFYFDLRVDVWGRDVRDIAASFGNGEVLIDCRRRPGERMFFGWGKR